MRATGGWLARLAAPPATCVRPKRAERGTCAVLFGAALWGRGRNRTLEECENALAGKPKLRAISSTLFLSGKLRSPRTAHRPKGSTRMSKKPAAWSLESTIALFKKVPAPLKTLADASSRRVRARFR